MPATRLNPLCEKKSIDAAPGDAGRRARRSHPQIHCARRNGRAAQRHPLVEDHVQPATKDDPYLRLRRPPVGRGDRQRSRSAGRPGDRTERRPGAAVVAGRSDDERVQVERTLHRLRFRPVGERCVRLRDSDERDAHGIVLVAVTVRIDGAVEPGDQLVASAVHELASVGGGLPAGDPDRQDRRRRRDAAQAVRAVRAGEDAGQLRPVLLDL